MYVQYHALCMAININSMVGLSDELVGSFVEVVNQHRQNYDVHVHVRLIITCDISAVSMSMLCSSSTSSNTSGLVLCLFCNSSNSYTRG